jgi:hypothetical protein
MPNPVTIGTILVLRAEFERIVCDANNLDAIRHRARIMLALLDELLRYREKEGK